MDTKMTKLTAKAFRSLLLIGFTLLLISTSAQNTPPVAVPDTVFSVIAQDTVAIPVLLNDYDPDGDNIEVNNARGARHGEKWENDSLVFYCSHFYVGKDSLYYRIKDDGDPRERSEYVYVHINVDENPNLPFAEDDFANTLSQKALVIDVLINDTDPNGDEIEIMEYTQPGHGEVSKISSTTLLYQPTHFVGVDSLTYRVIKKNTPKKYYSNWATVYINVDVNPDIPQATDDSVTVFALEPIEINLLDNDFDLNDDEIMILEVGETEHGEITILSDSVISYRSNYYTGLDSIVYRVIEKNNSTSYYSDWATVYINVEPKPDIPIVVSDSTAVYLFDTKEINASENDISVSGNPIEIFEVSRGSFLNDSIVRFRYYEPWDIGNREIRYRVREKNDTTLFSEWGTIFVNVLENPNEPQVVDDYATTTAGFPITINLLENDYNPTEDTIKIYPLWYETRYGRIECISDSIIQYTPYYNSEGIDSIEYRIRKLNGALIYSYGYLIVDVQPSGSYAILEGNNINAGINSYGYMFGTYDYIHGINPYQLNWRPGFETPAGSGKHTIFASNFWIGGIDNNTNILHLAGERYRQFGIDYSYGPISNIYDENYDRKYLRVWSLTDDQIGYHINHHNDPDYEMNNTISNWPANGDVNNGQLEQMAPFEDLNDNGVYEPLQGEYPLIRGDQAIFFIFNDDRYDHTESKGEKLSVEVHAMAYSYKNITDSALANTVFVHYDIINRSDRTYTDTYLASFTDLDINYPRDDYIGCDVQRGSYFGYDAETAQGDTLAAQSVTIVAGPFMDDDNNDNPADNCDESINGLNFGNGIVDDERFGMTSFVYFNNAYNSATGDPDSAMAYYNYMNAIWNDLTPLQYGGTGHLSFPGTVGPECKFMFPGDSDPCNWGTNGVVPNGGYNQNGKYWIEETGDNGEPNEPGDRRGLGICGPFTFEPGEKQQLDLAFVYAEDYSDKDGFTARDILFQRIDSIIQYVATEEILEFNEELSIKETAIESFEVFVYPNPAANELYFTTSLKNIDIEYSIIDIYGKTISRGHTQCNSRNKIDITDIDTGVYLLAIQAKNGTVISKFVKY